MSKEKEKEIMYDEQGNPVYPPKKRNPFLLGCLGLILLSIMITGCIIGFTPSEDINPDNQKDHVSDKEFNNVVKKTKSNTDDEALAKNPSSKEEALDTAQTYSDVLHLSESKIEYMLSDINEYEDEPVQYALDNVNADYEKNALESAKSYIETTPDVTEDELYALLTNMEYGYMFTEDEADYAIQNVDSYKPSKSNKSSSTDSSDNVSREFEAALQSAQNYVDTLPMSKAKLFEQLTSEYGSSFPEDAANYAIENVDVDYKEEAVESANTYNQTMPMSDQELLNQLTSEYGEGFTQEEAQYGLQNMDK